MASFALAGLVAVAIVGVLGVTSLRDAGEQEAIREAKELSRLAGVGIVAPNVPPDLVGGGDAARASLDRVVRRRVLGQPFLRVKLWTRDGRIVYSDEPRLIGSRYELDEDDVTSFETGEIIAGVSDLSSPENRYEERGRKLLEVYLPIETPAGEKLLFEGYLPFDSIASSGSKIWRSTAPALGLALVGLWLIQLPLAWSLARRLRRGQEEREVLLRHALEASELERRQIAQELHDGPVQRLAGLSYRLAATAREEDAGRGELTAALTFGAAEARTGMKELRGLLVGLAPPNLQDGGLRSALADVVAPLAAHGVVTHLDVPPDLALEPKVATLVFRVAQESVRNAMKHAEPTQVSVVVARRDGSVHLTVEDDGRGFQTSGLADVPPEHVGLRLLADLARDSGATLEVQSSPGAGSRIVLDAPVP